MKMTVIFLTYIMLYMCSVAMAKTKGLEAIVSELVEVNKAAGRSTEVINVLVSRVISSMEAVHDKQEGFFNGVQSSCKGGSRNLDSFIQNLNGDSVEVKATINKANSKAAEAQKSKKALKGQILKLKKNIADLVKSIKDEHDKYLKFGTETEQKLVTIKYVKDILTDELLAPRGRSFVQIQSKEFAQKVDDLKFMLNGLSAKESMYSSLAVTLLQVAEKKNFSDKKLLTKLLEIFSKLEKNVQAFSKSFALSQKRIIKDLKTSINAVKQQIKSTLNMYNEAASTIAFSDNLIKSSQRTLAVISSTIERKMIQKRSWEKICKYQDNLRTVTYRHKNAFNYVLNKLKGARVLQ